VPFTLTTIKGVSYAMFDAQPDHGPRRMARPPGRRGDQRDRRERDRQLATISGRPTSVELSCRLRRDADDTQLNATNGNLVTAHTVTLPGMTPNTRYYYSHVSRRVGEHDNVASRGERALTFITTRDHRHDETRSPSGTLNNPTSPARPTGSTPSFRRRRRSSLARPFRADRRRRRRFRGSATVSGGALTLDVPGRAVGHYSIRAFGGVRGHLAASGTENLGIGTDWQSTPYARFKRSVNGCSRRRAQQHLSPARPQSRDRGRARHVFRMDGSSGGYVFSIDGRRAATHSITISARCVRSPDTATGGGTLEHRLAPDEPYASSVPQRRGSRRRRDDEWQSGYMGLDVPANTTLTCGPHGQHPHTRQFLESVHQVPGDGRLVRTPGTAVQGHHEHDGRGHHAVAFQIAITYAAERRAQDAITAHLAAAFADTSGKSEVLRVVTVIPSRSSMAIPTLAVMPRPDDRHRLFDLEEHAPAATSAAPASRCHPAR